MVSEHLPGARIRFIKVDVKGFELDVLEGAQALLCEERPNLQVEIGPTRFQRLLP